MGNKLSWTEIVEDFGRILEEENSVISFNNLKNWGINVTNGIPSF